MFGPYEEFKPSGIFVTGQIQRVKIQARPPYDLRIVRRKRRCGCRFFFCEAAATRNRSFRNLLAMTLRHDAA
jgi:hypothetical protein